MILFCCCFQTNFSFWHPTFFRYINIYSLLRNLETLLPHLRCFRSNANFRKINQYFHTGCTYISLKVLKDHTALYRTKCNKTESSSKFQIWSFKNTFHFYSYGRTLTIYRNIESHLSQGVLNIYLSWAKEIRLVCVLD